MSVITFIKVWIKDILSIDSKVATPALKVMVKEDNFLNRQIADYFNVLNVQKGILVLLGKRTVKTSRYGTRFVMMAVPTPENVITGIIGKIKTVNRGTRAKEIIDACALSTTPAILPATIVTYRAHLATFTAAVGAAKKAAWKIVYNDLKALLFAFQVAGNADQPNCITILEGGKFRIKGVGSKQKQVFGLTNGVDSGTVDLIGNTINKGARLHDWWISLDLGVTWTRMDPTLDSFCSMTDLTVGATVGFGHQLIVGKGDNGKLEYLYITIT